jgi:hypothetical protein
VVSYEKLRDEVQIEAAGFPPEQSLHGEFVFDPWLSNSLLTGHIERVDDERESG